MEQLFSAFIKGNEMRIVIRGNEKHGTGFQVEVFELRCLSEERNIVKYKECLAMPAFDKEPLYCLQT